MNKVVLITGSGKERVGNYVAHYLAERGYDIAIHYRSSRQEAEETVRVLSKKVKAAAFQADITKDKERETLVQKVVEKFGRIDVLVNAASKFGRSRPGEEGNEAEDYLRVNLISQYDLSWRVGRQMIKQGPGDYSIILFGDWATERPYPGYADYLLSKAGVQGSTRILANELKPNKSRPETIIRVNCILPGPVMLPLDMSDEEKELAVSKTLVNHEGNPLNIAQGVLYAIENDFVDGDELKIEGGKTIRSEE